MEPVSIKCSSDLNIEKTAIQFWIFSNLGLPLSCFKTSCLINEIFVTNLRKYPEKKKLKLRKTEKLRIIL